MLRDREREDMSLLFRSAEDLEIEAITERIRAVLSRQPGHTLRVAADALQIPALDLARLLDKRERFSDRTFVNDVVAALVHEGGVDPRWLLTGEYDGNVHRQALLLGEDRGGKGRSAVREFVEQQYQGLKRESILAWRPWRKGARPKQPVTKPKARSA
jgi:hypothetical protein